jgi:hypothetical protein
LIRSGEWGPNTARDRTRVLTYGANELARMLIVYYSTVNCGGSEASYPWSNAGRFPDLTCSSAIPERTLISKPNYRVCVALPNGTVKSRPAAP